MITQERLKQILHYNPDSGSWTWIQSIGTIPEGTQAGCIRPDGYLAIRIDGIQYLSSRLAFLYMNGSFPKMFIDHKNRVRNDDRWCNLRECNNSQNQMNKGLQRNNKSGIPGVYFYKQKNKWVANIRKDGKTIYLGIFDSKYDAIECRKKAEIQLFGEYASCV